MHETDLSRHMSSVLIIDAAVNKYIKEKGGFEFYAKRINREKSRISNDGIVTLVSAKDSSVVVQYQLDELGLSPESVNSSIAETSNSTSSMPGEYISFSGDKRLTYSIGAVIALAIGTVSPVVSLPIKGSINYLAGGRGDGILVLALTVASAYFVLNSNYRKLLYTGVCSLAIIFTSLWWVQIIISEAKSSLDSSLQGNMFRGLAEAAFSSFGLEWGWFLLIGGSIALIVISKLKKDGNGFSLPFYCLKPIKGSMQENIPAIVILTAGVGWTLANLIYSFFRIKSWGA